MEHTPEHKLGEFVLKNLIAKDQDECGRLLKITEEAVRLGFGEHYDSSWPDQPWLIPKGMGYMTCSHTHCLAEIIGRPGDLCDDCKDADEGVTSCNGCDNDG